MHWSINFLIVAIFCFGLGVLIGRSKLKRKGLLRVISVIVAIAISFTLSLLPSPETKITFETPEAAFLYNNTKITDVALVVEGSNSAYMVGQQNGDTCYTIVSKTKDGWKIGNNSHDKIIGTSVCAGIFLIVYTHTPTGDYYLEIYDYQGKELTISDPHGTQFHSLKNPGIAGRESFFRYYAYVPEYDAEYSVTANGQEITWGPL